MLSGGFNIQITDYFGLQGDLPGYEEVYETLTQRIAALEELNDGSVIPSLREAEQSLEHEFVKASELATALETQLEVFQGQKENLEGKIREHANWLGQVREKLAQVDDISGSDEVLVKRLETTKLLKSELDGCSGKLDQLQGQLQEMSSQYKAAETTGLTKDISVLRKKEEAAGQKAKKVEETLQHALEQHLEEARQETVRWLTTAKDKVHWCADLSGDKYSVEAKLATVKDLLAQTAQGEQKTMVMVQKMDLLKAAVGPDGRAQLEQEKQQGQQDWATFLTELEQAK